ncbi:MAG: transcriptional regulator [Pseudomonadaceae bacterium]|nr:transcriptional regulator [Pseudomonadaceae bacterium]
MRMQRLILSLGLLAAFDAQASNGRYLTWVDDQGRVHNTFVDSAYGSQQRSAERRITQSDQARLADQAQNNWPGTAGSNESKRRYFTWVDAGGTMQSSFYAGAQQLDGQKNLTLPNGQHSSDYIDAEAFEDKGFVRSENGNPYYTWADEQGRMHNSPISAEQRADGLRSGAQASNIKYTEGRQVEFNKPAAELPGLDGQMTPAMRALLEGSKEKSAGLYQNLQDSCCVQLADGAFTELSADEPRYQELNGLSPSFDFPMGRSYYAALKLPSSQRTYGLRVRSFANKQVVYPSLLFLDERKHPTRLVSDAVYQLHAETWYRYAFIEGTIPVNAMQGERYVLLLTTAEDRQLQTLDNKPFKRPLQDLALDEAGMQVHQHAEVGGFELAVVR